MWKHSTVYVIRRTQQEQLAAIHDLHDPTLSRDLIMLAHRREKSRGSVDAGASSVSPSAWKHTYRTFWQDLFPTDYSAEKKIEHDRDGEVLLLIRIDSNGLFLKL